MALVLGAGGVAGHSFHAGVLRALEEQTGWDPRSADLVVGTSAGSVVGLGLRAGLSTLDLYAATVDEPLSPAGEHLLARLPPRDGGYEFEWRPRAGLPVPASPRLLARLAARPWRSRPSLVLAGLLPRGRVDPAPIARDTETVLEQCGTEPERLWVVTVRLSDGRRVVFGRGDEADVPGWRWGDAVAASCAIPGFFEPVVVGDVHLVDGGAHSPTNADLLDASAFDLVIVSSPMSATRSARFQSVDAPVRALYRLRLAAELAGVRRRGVPVLTFQPTPEVLAASGLNAMDPGLRVPVARASYEAAARRLDGTVIPAVELLSA